MRIKFYIGSEVHIDIFDDRMEIYSPGGMVDGINIQDRAPLSVPSTRRNPLLADIFERLGYMERKGSGFEKILSSYEFQVNYSKDKKPRFRSDRSQFTVIMPNLNYELRDQANQDANQANQAPVDLLTSAINKNPAITQRELVKATGLSLNMVKYYMLKMQEDGLLVREGTSQKGKWVIKENK